MTDADGYDKINIFKYIKRLEKHLICKSACQYESGVVNKFYEA